MDEGDEDATAAEYLLPVVLELEQTRWRSLRGTTPTAAAAEALQAPKAAMACRRSITITTPRQCAL